MKRGLIWTCLAAGLAVAFGHEHDGRACSGPSKSLEAMELNNDYKMRHSRELKRAEVYRHKMKLRKDHQFRSSQLMYDSETGEKTKDNKLLRRLREERRQLYDDYEDGIDDEPVISIPIVFHVLYSNDDENLSNDQLDSQVRVLNEDFRANNDQINDGDVDSIWTSRIGDTKLEFYRAGVERVSISGKGSSFCSDEENIKLSSNGGSDQWDPSTYLNFWVCDLSAEGLLGYAYFPCLLDTSLEWKDGVVVTSGAVGSSDDNDGSFYFSTSEYDLGRTATHEVGHYLALNHIWGYYDSCSTSDTDGIDDTPLQSGPNYGCPTDDPDSCSETDSESGTDLPDMTINFMDYVDDACMYVFTEEQSWEMRSVMKGCRIDMYNNGVNSSSQTTAPETTSPGGTSGNDTTGDNNFVCEDGCEIPQEYFNDGYCDCSTCEDEQYWGCNNCTSTGCPTTCYDWSYCDGTGTGSTTGGTGGTDDYFDCEDGCQISSGYVDDHWCDCSKCEDETDWECETCSEGCPTDCGDYTYCSSDATATTSEASNYYECDDGCLIFSSYVNDNYCDCSNCEDEDCNSCDTCSFYYDDCSSLSCGDDGFVDGTIYCWNGTTVCDNPGTTGGSDSESDSNGVKRMDVQCIAVFAVFGCLLLAGKQ